MRGAPNGRGDSLDSKRDPEPVAGLVFAQARRANRQGFFLGDHRAENRSARDVRGRSGFPIRAASVVRFDRACGG